VSIVGRAVVIAVVVALVVLLAIWLLTSRTDPGIA
jgi:hypothetical protein